MYKYCRNKDNTVMHSNYLVPDIKCKIPVENTILNNYCKKIIIGVLRSIFHVNFVIYYYEGSSFSPA